MSPATALPAGSNVRSTVAPEGIATMVAFDFRVNKDARHRSAGKERKICLK